MNFLAEFSWIFNMKTAESEKQYNIQHLYEAVLFETREQAWDCTLKTYPTTLWDLTLKMNGPN